MSHRPTPSYAYEAGDAARGEILVVAASHHSGRACGGLQPHDTRGGYLFSTHKTNRIPADLTRAAGSSTDQVDARDDVHDRVAVGASTPELPARSRRYASSRCTPTSSWGSGRAMTSPTRTVAGSRVVVEQPGERHFLDAADRVAVAQDRATARCRWPASARRPRRPSPPADGHQRARGPEPAAGRRRSARRARPGANGSAAIQASS